MQKVFIFEEGADAPREIAIGEIFAGKKGVLFGLPGARPQLHMHCTVFFERC